MYDTHTHLLNKSLKSLYDGESFVKNIDENLRGDKKFMGRILSIYGRELEYAAENIRNDEEIVLGATRNFPEMLKYASLDLRNNKTFLKKYLDQYNNYYFNNLPEARELDIAKYFGNSVLNNKDFIIFSAKCHVNMFDYIDEKLKNDETILLTIFRCCKSSNELVERLISLHFGDEKFILDLILVYKPRFVNYYYLLEKINKNLLDNENFVKKMVNIDSHTLKYASERLRNDKNFILSIYNCSHSYFSLDCLGENICADKNVVLSLLENKRVWDINGINCNLSDDKDIILKAIKVYGGNYFYASRRLMNDKDVILNYANNCIPQFFKSQVLEKYSNDKEFITSIMKRNPDYFIYASREIQQDPELLRIAVLHNPSILELLK